MKCGGVNLDRSTPPCVSWTRSTRRNGRSVGGSTFSEEPHATSLTLLRSLLTMNRGFLHLGETKVLKPPLAAFLPGAIFGRRRMYHVLYLVGKHAHARGACCISRIILFIPVRIPLCTFWRGGAGEPPNVGENLYRRTPFRISYCFRTPTTRHLNVLILYQTLLQC